MECDPFTWTLGASLHSFLKRPMGLGLDLSLFVWTCGAGGWTDLDVSFFEKHLWHTSRYCRQIVLESPRMYPPWSRALASRPWNSDHQYI